MAKIIYDPAPIDWTTKFTPSFYIIYNAAKEGWPIAWGYTDHLLEVWCFCYDPSNDAETRNDWGEDEDEED